MTAPAAHPFAEIFPLMEGMEFDDLVASIKANGQRDGVTLYRGLILDGRNRQRVCDVLGMKCRYETLPAGVDPLAFVLDKNLKRRHLNDDQRRMVAAKIANMPRGRPAENPAVCGIKIADAARLANVDKAGAERARTVVAKASPEVNRAVERGKLTVAAAAQAAKLDPEKQRRIAQEAEAGRANVVRTAIKQEARAVRERELGERQLAVPEGKCGVIVEDFEWDHETWSDWGRDRAAENHYPVSRDAHTAAEIVARTADRFAYAADDCVCFMWTTLQHAAIAMDVLRLRGFDYRSQYAWGKDKIGLGLWSREKHEILLIGVKGNIPCPAPGTQRHSLIMAPRGEHSAKPEYFREMIEQYFPTLPKLELNCRGPGRPGWLVWGNQANAPIAVEAAMPIASEATDVPAASAPALSIAQAALDIPDCLRIGHPDCWRSALVPRAPLESKAPRREGP